MKKIFGWIILTAILVATIGSMTAVTAIAEQENDVVLSSQSMVSGEELLVIVKVEKNDGINILSMRVEYDEDSLEFVGRIRGSALASLGYGDNFDEETGVLYAYPYRAIYSGTLKNDTTTGTLVTLRFRVREGAVGENKVRVIVREVGYMKEGKTDAPVYNSKYGAAVDLSDPDALLSGGVEMTAATYEISSKGEVIVPKDPEKIKKSNPALIVTLALVGAVVVVGGIILAVYLLKRKQTK